MKIFLILLALIYSLSPVDISPDFIPGLGWLDDIGIWVLLFFYFYRSRKTGSNRESENGEDTAKAPEMEGAKDPHTLLGVTRDATSDEIKSAYRELANKYHPDKVVHLGEEFRVLAEEKFKEIQNAYRELTQ